MKGKESLSAAHRNPVQPGEAREFRDFGEANPLKARGPSFLHPGHFYQGGLTCLTF